MAKPDIRELLIDCVLDPELLRRMQETPDAVLNEYDVSDRAREILLSPDAGLLELLGEAVGQEQVERRPEKTETPDVNKSESAAEPANSPAVSTLPQSRLALRLVPYAQQAPSSIGGAPEVIVVESSQSGGARLAVYGYDRGALRPVAATPEIGRRNRWLAPAGVADLNGDGQLDIAYVETPHLAGVLRIWTFSPDGISTP